MLELKKVSKEYRVKEKRKVKNKKILKEIDLKIPKGKIVGLLGVNGAGKSTTIKILSSMLEVSGGEILIDGKAASEKELQNKTDIILGGEKSLYWRLTGMENLIYFGSLQNMSRKDTIVIAEKLLKIVDLYDSKDVLVEKYSKGMKQRLQIVRGLLGNPEYLLLDEPTLGLDIHIAREVRKYIKKIVIEENKGLLLTSHYMAEVEELCDYIYILDDGEILMNGTKNEIKRKVMQYNEIRIVSVAIDQIRSFLEQEFKNEIKYLSKNHTELIIRTQLEKYDLIAALFKKNLYYEVLTTNEPSLEDVLLEVFKDE